MKVYELIAELQRIDNLEREVLTEGCDCYGKAVRVAIDPNDGKVIICRDEDGRGYYNDNS